MVHILLLILKAIGILILVLLGLVLAVVCLVLFVPVCYEAGGSWKDKPAGKGKISWLFGAVSLRAGYDGDESGLTAGVRLFGQKLWEMGEEKETPKAPRPLDEETLRGTDAERKEPEEKKTTLGKRNAFRLHRQRTPKRPCQRTRSPDWSLRIKDIQSIKRRMYSAAQKVFLKNLSFLFSHFVISLRIYKTLQKKRKPGWRMKKIRRRLSFSGSRRAVFCAMYVPEEGRDP